MFEAFLEPEVSEIVGAEFVAQEGGELLVLFEESIFPVGAEDMMPVLDLLQVVCSLPGRRRVIWVPKISEIFWAVRRHKPSSQLRSKRR